MAAAEVIVGVDVEALVVSCTSGCSVVTKLGWTPSPSEGSSIDNWRLESGALLCSLSIFMALLWASSIENTSWRATRSWMIYLNPLMYFVVCYSFIILSLIVYTAMWGGRTSPWTPQQFLCLICIAQIGYKKTVGDRVERIYLIGVALCVSMSSRVACLATSLWFVTGVTMRLLLLWACTPRTWYDFLRGRKSCRRTFQPHRPSLKRNLYQGSYWRKKSRSSPGTHLNLGPLLSYPN